MVSLNGTHDPARKSWVESANEEECDFPIQNLPFGIFRSDTGPPRGGIAIGDQILDIPVLIATGLLEGQAADAAQTAAGPTLNPLMALGNGAASALRASVSDLLSQGAPQQAAVKACLVPMNRVTMELPADIRHFTDFLCSYEHTQRLSVDGTLPPAFSSVPIAYNSRASTVRVSGTPFIRPNGQYMSDDGEISFGPEPRQDFELELGFYVGPGNDIGKPISIKDAPDQIFGYCLLNDWSARGIQFWQSRPLGPFLGKSSMTSVSPWVITAEALLPFATEARLRENDIAPPAYLSSPEVAQSGGIDIRMFADWLPRELGEKGQSAVNITDTNFKFMHWTPAQMLAHHASNGCSLLPGDLLGSGTVSGPTDETRACLAEITERGSVTVDVGGTQRVWLEDGDEVIFRARAEADGYVPIGFGECRGIIEPAVKWPS